ncbi:hypothetical protein VPH35_096782 [Triticum aestivum]
MATYIVYMKIKMYIACPRGYFPLFGYTYYCPFEDKGKLLRNNFFQIVLSFSTHGSIMFTFCHLIFMEIPINILPKQMGAATCAFDDLVTCISDIILLSCQPSYLPSI